MVKGKIIARCAWCKAPFPKDYIGKKCPECNGPIEEHGDKNA